MKTSKRYIPNYLFAEPSFLGGMASVFDLGGTLHIYNTSNTDKDADALAIGNDWRAVGEDIKSAIFRHEQQYRKKTS